MTLSERIRALFEGDLARNIYELVALLFNQQDAIVWPAITVVSAASYTLTDEDNGTTLVVPIVSTINVPDTLSKGFSCIILQDSASTVTVAATGTTTFLIVSTAADPIVADGEGSSIVLSKIDGTRVHVSGAAAA